MERTDARRSDVGRSLRDFSLSAARTTQRRNPGDGPDQRAGHSHAEPDGIKANDVAVGAIIEPSVGPPHLQEQVETSYPYGQIGLAPPSSALRSLQSPG